MKNSDILLFFLLFYIITISIIFGYMYYKLKKENNDLHKYNEDLIFELANIRRKCYYKNRKEKE